MLYCLLTIEQYETWCAAAYWSVAHVTRPMSFVDATRCSYVGRRVWHLLHGANLEQLAGQRRTPEREKKTFSPCKQLSWHLVCTELSLPRSRRRLESDIVLGQTFLCVQTRNFIRLTLSPNFSTGVKMCGVRVAVPAFRRCWRLLTVGCVFNCRVCGHHLSSRLGESRCACKVKISFSHLAPHFSPAAALTFLCWPVKAGVWDR